MITIGDRIKETLASKGITPYKLSMGTGISQSTLTRMLRNDSTPNKSTITLISKFLKVNPEWILTGEGDKFAYASIIPEINEPTTEYLNIDDVADYVIENEDELLKNKKFATWYNNILLKAENEFFKKYINPK